MNEKDFIRALDSRNNAEIETYIRKDSEFQIFQDQNIKFGNSQFKVDIPLLVEWFQSRKAKVGSQQTTNELRKFLDVQSIPGKDVLAITGISVDEEIKLTSEVALIPFEKLTTSYVGSLFDKTKLPFFLSSYAPTTVLICENKSQPKFTSDSLFRDKLHTFQKTLSLRTYAIA